MKKEQNIKLSGIIANITAVIILLCGIMLISSPEAMKQYIPYIFIGQLLLKVISYIFSWQKNRTKYEFVSFIVSLILIVVFSILFIIFKNNETLLVVMLAVSCVIQGINNIVTHIFNQDIKRNKLFYLFITLIYFILAFAVIQYLFVATYDLKELITIYGITFVYEGLVLFNVVNTKKKQGIFTNVLTKTYFREIIIGLIFTMMLASFLLVNYEPTISSFGDGMWYCFAVITTIGFGDFAAVSSFGRILTVLLGVYGIIVVALITSIIVNIYNETKDK